MPVVVCFFIFLDYLELVIINHIWTCLDELIFRVSKVTPGGYYNSNGFNRKLEVMEMIGSFTSVVLSQWETTC